MNTDKAKKSLSVFICGERVPRGTDDMAAVHAAGRTTPPGRYVVLYDGRCRFCSAGAQQLTRLARPETIELESFQEPGVLERFPGIPLEACMRRMHLVTPDGRVYGGFEAAVQALATRPLLGLLARVYYVPGIRQVLELLYAVIAANRYRLMGKTAAAEGCEDGTCQLHFRPRP